MGYQDATPTPFDQQVIRSHDQLKLFDNAVLNAVATVLTSPSFECGAFRHFTLYLGILSAGTPTTVQFVIEFLNQYTNAWCKFDQGLFASLFYEDQDTATELNVVFLGDVIGRQFRIRALGTGTTAANTFTINASVEFYT